MGKSVVYAQLREVFFVPGMKNGNFGPTLPNTNATLKNFKMTLQDSGDLLMEWEEGNYTQSYTVSSSNIKGCKHAPVSTQKETPVATPQTNSKETKEEQTTQAQAVPIAPPVKKSWLGR